MTNAQRRRVGRSKLLNEAEVAALSAYPDPDHPDDPTAQVVNCYYCRKLLRPRRSTARIRYGGNRIVATVVDHFFGDCDAVEVDRG